MSGIAGEFDYTKPFTTSELVLHFGLGSPQDPQVTKPLYDELVAKGYSLKIIRRGDKRERVWAKWPKRPPFVMPVIP